MLRAAVVLACSLALAVLVHADDPTPVPTYSVNLDLEPEERWKEVATAYAKPILEAIAFVNVYYRFPGGKHTNDTNTLLEALSFPTEYQREMQGIATTLNVTYEEVVAANLVNALSNSWPIHADTDAAAVAHPTDCTSIVALRSNGTVYHARNQDYPALFRPLVVNVLFTRGGQLQYHATVFAGCVGISGSAESVGGFTFSINARSGAVPAHGTRIGAVIAAARSGALPVFMPARIALDAGMSYANAVARLSTAKILTPVYFIIGGVTSTEGAVISRNRTAAVNTLPLGTAQTGGQSWYVLQTNDDNWKPPMDPRRDAGLASMNAVGSDNVDLSALMQVLSKPPVFANDTLHTELMSASLGLYAAYLRSH